MATLRRRWALAVLTPALAACVIGLGSAIQPEALERPTAFVQAPAPVGRRAPQPVRRLSLATGAKASTGDPAGALSGDPTPIWAPRSGGSEWVAIPLREPAPETLLLTWNAVGFGYLNLDAAPRGYVISVSSDSTDGVDGSWREVFAVAHNPVRARAETFRAPGARWVKLYVESTWNGRIALRDLAVFGSAAKDNLDAWLICGDSISDGSFNAVATKDFVATVSKALPAHSPIVIDGSTSGDNAQAGIIKLRSGLKDLPPGGYVAIAFGTNDTAQNVPLATFRANLQQLVDLVQASGRKPMIARIPWFPNPKVVDYLAVVDETTQANQLQPGPDLYTWFKSHPEELGADKIHPNAVGRRSVQRLWGEAAVRAYLSP